MSEPLDQDNEKKSDGEGAETRDRSDQSRTPTSRSESSEQTLHEDQPKEFGELKEKLKACEAKAERYLNGWKRTQADYQNLTRRMAQHETELIRYATEEFVEELLSVSDSFDRALQILTDEEKTSGVAKGFTAIYKEFTNLLKTHDVIRIETEGKPFNPELHEPVGEEVREGVASGVIVEEVRAGYRMGEKVIRPARVKVAK